MPTETLGPYQLTFTAQRTKGRVLVLIDGRPVPLTISLLRLTARLAQYHVASGGSLYLAKPGTSLSTAVSRLRRTIDEALGPGYGRRLIETGLGMEYRLAPSTTVSLDPSVTDGAASTLPDSLVKLLRRLLPAES